jgi:hypothetical protein
MLKKIRFSIIIIFLMILGLWMNANGVDVGKFRRHVISLTNATYAGNPFDLEVDATFTHTSSGTTIDLPGYYDGSNTWKIGFMPTLLGEWTYTTSSSDADLNSKTGSLTCVASTLPGILKADPDHLKKWKFTDGDYTVPIALRMPFLCETATDAQFEAAADFMKANNLHMMEFVVYLRYSRLEYGGSFPDYLCTGSCSNHQMDLSAWTQINKRLDMLADRGLGAHLMFWGDDADTPTWSGQSATEEFVLRYTVARCAGYPIIIWNSGIDIGEYRSNSDVDWFVAKVQEFDGYNHPMSSRNGGGSGGHNPATQTFNSDGYNQAKISEMLRTYNEFDLPGSMDDAWGENRGSHGYKDHTEHDIRRAFWKCMVAGGLGGLVRGGCDGYTGTGCYSLLQLQSDLESEQWLKLVNPFINQRLGALFGEMEPNTALVSGAYCLADANHKKMLFWTPGANDRYDGNSGGAFTVKLTGVSGSFQATWIDPRTGNESAAGTLSSGSDHSMSPSSTDDWALLLEASPVGLRGQMVPDRNWPTLNISPNPFRPITIIGIRKGEQEALSLRIFDVHGHLIDDLTQEAMHQDRILWNGDLRPSGIYIAELRSGTKTASKRLMLVK